MKAKYNLIIFLILSSQLFTNCRDQQNSNNYVFESSSHKHEENRIDSSLNTLLSRYLLDLGETAIFSQQNSNSDIYRFTFIPHYSTKNYAYTIWSDHEKYFGKISIAEYNLSKDSLIDLQIKISDININQIIELNEHILKNQLQKTRTHNNYSGVDGSDWVLEIKNRNEYKLIKRWNLEKKGNDPKIFEICQKIKTIVSD